MGRRIVCSLAVAALLAGCGARTGLRVEPFDAGPDAGRDAGPDAGRDAGPDAGRDAGPDAGRDAGPEAGRDAGPPVGCADGMREAFVDLARYPNVAGCAGGWSVAGVARASPPSCGRAGGDDGRNPSGAGCNVADLCAEGWHVCESVLEMRSASPDGCAGGRDAPGAFFVTRQSGPGCGICASGGDPTCTGRDCRRDCAMTARTTNDLFGCGTIGDPADGSSCSVLDRFSNNVCSALPSPWFCTDDGSGTHEADTVTKNGPGAGGVLCCRDGSV